METHLPQVPIFLRNQIELRVKADEPSVVLPPIPELPPEILPEMLTDEPPEFTAPVVEELIQLNLESFHQQFDEMETSTEVEIHRPQLQTNLSLMVLSHLENLKREQSSLSSDLAIIDSSLDWQSLLRNRGSFGLNREGNLGWGQLNQMLATYTPETNWMTLSYGSAHMSMKLITYAYYFLKNLIQSGQWHHPETAQILYYRWKNLPAIKMTWIKPDLPPLFFEEIDGFEIFIDQNSANEEIQILEIDSHSTTGNEL